MELHRFFRYAIEKMCKEKKSLNHFSIAYFTLILHKTKPSACLEKIKIHADGFYI